jgi:phage/plasmid primase-like uncharacterized protein
MGNVDARDVQDDFARELKAMGLLETEPVMDGKFHRCPVDGAKKGSLDGAYVGYLDGRPAGYIENHKSGAKSAWKFGFEPDVVAPGEREARRLHVAELIAAREAKQVIDRENVSAKAERMWARLSKERPRECPYLDAKGADGHGLGFASDGGIFVPMRDTAGKLWSLQRIGPDGEKTFLKGGRKAGCFHVVGTVEDGKPFLIAEGYATASTVAALTGLPCVCAFDAGNIGPVAEAMIARHPKSFVCVMADNDRFCKEREDGTPFNPGVEFATAAAGRLSMGVAVPSFAARDGNGTDYNDLARTSGLNAAREQALEGIRAAMERSYGQLRAKASESSGTELSAVAIEPGKGPIFGTPVAFGYGMIAFRQGKDGVFLAKASRFESLPERFKRQRMSQGPDGRLHCAPAPARERAAVEPKALPEMAM